MKKLLVRKELCLYWYKSGVRVEDGSLPPGLRGDCTYLSGDCTGLRGDCTYLSGDCTGLSGDCTYLSGDLDDCEIADKERKSGVKIFALVGTEPPNG